MCRRSSIYKGWELGHGNIFFKTGISRRNMEIYKWKWMVLGVLGFMNNADFIFKKVNDIMHIVSIFRFQ